MRSGDLFAGENRALILVILICSLIYLAQIPAAGSAIASSGAMQPYPMPTSTPTSTSTPTATPTSTLTPTPTPVSVIYLPLILKGWPPTEFRGLWVDRWSYKSPDDIQAIVQKAAQANFNSIFFQVRGKADAYYQSNHEPWAAGLTVSGTLTQTQLGQDPDWDPLQTAIDQAHAAELELHAWVNVFSCWSGETPPITTCTPTHIYNEHPEWLQCDESGTPMPLKAEPG